MEAVVILGDSYGAMVDCDTAAFVGNYCIRPIAERGEGEWGVFLVTPDPATPGTLRRAIEGDWTLEQAKALLLTLHRMGGA